jgi:hypothetical protein
MTRAIPCVIALLGLGMTVGSALLFSSSVQPSTSLEIRPTWTEFKWPFLLDQWGIGRAFVCKPVDCGSEIKVYLRPKIGFCNCTTGVLDDRRTRSHRIALMRKVLPDLVAAEVKSEVADCFAVVPQVMEQDEWLRNRGQPRYPAASELKLAGSGELAMRAAGYDAE